MFGYYLDLALRSLKRSPGLTALMVLSIGVGVALAMTTWTLVRTMSSDPIPQKSAQLFVPTIDMWGPSARGKESGDDEPPAMLDYSTVMALLSDHRAHFQSAAYWIQPTVIPARSGKHPFGISGFAVSSELFPMLDVPFLHGSGWSSADDATGAQVVVISSELNDQIFDGGNSVGKTLNLHGGSYRVAGVMRDWNPQPVYFDVPANGGFMLKPISVLLPFNTAIAAQVTPHGSSDCNTARAEPGFAGLLHSSCVWISYIAQLDDAHAVQTYQQYLEGFARKHFDWPPNVRLRGLMAWLDYLQVVPPGIQVLRLVGMGLLLVCLVDTIGLMLAKFLRRSSEIGVRRALGAPRGAIYAQFLTEGAVIGVAGGVIGLLLTWLSMLWLRQRLPEGWSALTPVDVQLLALALLVAILATLLAALYPTFRAAHVEPAWQLKSN